MITFGATFKPFIGKNKDIQLNALKSWLEFSPPCEIILLGNEEGLEEIAKQYRLMHIPDIHCNEFGTSLLSDLLKKLQETAKHDIICYINSDIILLDNPLPLVNAIVKKFEKFLLFCRRYEVKIDGQIDFNNSSWRHELIEKIRGQDVWKAVMPVDTFIFRRGLFVNTPPFAIGRGVWARWLVYEALKQRVPVIDATLVLRTVHQLHDYSHVASSSKQESGWVRVKFSKEYLYNARVAGIASYFSDKDATHVVDDEGLKVINDVKRILRRTVKRPLLDPRLTPLLLGLRRIFSSRKIRSVSKKFLHKLDILYS